MFTQQSGQIENALRSAGVPDISAREMMSGMANCQATLEHRGPMALTKPAMSVFPNVRPAGPAPNAQVSPPGPINISADTKNTFINIPPWQNIPFTPLPYLPVPPWQTVGGPGWTPTPLEDPALRVSGPVDAGPIKAPSAKVANVTSQNIANAGDIVNQGDIANGGDVRTENVTVENDLTVQNNVTNNGPVTNNSTVINNGDTYNNSVHNQHTVNHGPTYHHSESHFDGPNHIHGPTHLYGPTFVRNSVFVSGRRLTPLTVDVVTNVTWDGTILQKTIKTLRVFGTASGEATATVLDCGS